MDCHLKLSWQASCLIFRICFFLDKKFPPCLRSSNPSQICFCSCITNLGVWHLIAQIGNHLLHPTICKEPLVPLCYLLSNTLNPTTTVLVKTSLDYYMGSLTLGSSSRACIRSPELILLKCKFYFVIPLLKAFQWFTTAFRRNGLDWGLFSIPLVVG